MVVSTGAIDCLERLVSEMTYYVSSGTSDPTHSVTHSAQETGAEKVCVHCLHLQSGPFVLKSPALSAFHQQLWLTMHAHVHMDITRSELLLLLSKLHISHFVILLVTTSVIVLLPFLWS